MLYQIISSFFINFSKLFIREIRGLENLPKGGYILAANHDSLLDPPLITSIITWKFKRKVHNLAKSELFQPFIGRKFHEAVETIPLDMSLLR